MMSWPSVHEFRAISPAGIECVGHAPPFPDRGSSSHPPPDGPSGWPSPGLNGGSGGRVVRWAPSLADVDLGHGDPPSLLEGRPTIVAGEQLCNRSPSDAARRHRGAPSAGFPQGRAMRAGDAAPGRGDALDGGDARPVVAPRLRLRSSPTFLRILAEKPNGRCSEWCEQYQKQESTNHLTGRRQTYEISNRTSDGGTGGVLMLSTAACSSTSTTRLSSSNMCKAAGGTYSKGTCQPGGDARSAQQMCACSRRNIF